MARIPTFEEILLEVNQSLGLARPQSKYIDQFSALEMTLDRHREMAERLVQSITQALDLDEYTLEDFDANLVGWMAFHKGLELNTWTGGASQQQVLWHLLAYSFVPSLSRAVAFLSLAAVEREQPIAPDMPGGEFWFLPMVNQEENCLDLPFPRTVEWLLDLLGAQSLEKAAQGFEWNQDGGSALRRVQTWRLDRRLPKSAEEIREFFHDDVKLEFLGAFKDDVEASEELRFAAALDFVRHKGLDANTLQDQIPMTVERLAAVFDGTAPITERQDFVCLISQRYRAPSMRIIRQRMLVARMVQDGYKRLVKFLCPGVDGTCADPIRNKVLQLIGLFHTVYNLTIAAWKNGGGHEEQDVWFEERLAPWDRADLLLSILPSLRPEQRALMLAERLTRAFIQMAPECPLEDLIPFDESMAGAVTQRRMSNLQLERDEALRLEKLTARVRTASPWRALQAEDSYAVVSQLVQDETLPAKTRMMSLRRLRELADTSMEKAGCVVIELGFFLNAEPGYRTEDVLQRVQALLDEIQAGKPGYEEWKAPLLRFRAKHQLMQNRFDEALTDFDEALDACLERSFGALRGEIARDAWATTIVQHGFKPREQEKYYRNMIAYGMFEERLASFQDTAVWCEEFFWSDLYKPYPGFERVRRPAMQEFKVLFTETFGLIDTADWGGLREWMKRHAHEFRKTNLKDARRNSILLQWLKLMHHVESSLPSFRFARDDRSNHIAGKMDLHLKNWRQAVRILLDTWPEQARIADFKGQTPLMIVADNGDAELTRLLAPLSDIDAQDYLGRTALHAAVTGCSAECASAILEHNPDVLRVTNGEENTALHTAVRFGIPETVRLIAQEFPGLVAQVNSAGQTPLDLAKDIAARFIDWTTYMRKQNRRAGTKVELDEIIAVLIH